METGGKPSVKYYWFPTKLGTSVIVKGKRKHDFPIPDVSPVLFDQDLSLMGNPSSVVAARHCKPAFRNVRNVLSKSILTCLSGSPGSNLDSKDGPCIGSCNGLLVNIVGIDGQEDTLFLYNSGQSDATRLPLVNKENCDSDSKAGSCLSESISLGFKFHKSIKQNPVFDPFAGGNAGILFWSYVSNIQFKLPIQFANGYGCGGRVEFPGLCSTGSFCDLRRLVIHLEKLLISQKYLIVGGAWNFQGISSAQNGNAGGSRIICENFHRRASERILNILRKDDFRGCSTSNETSKPFSARAEENCKFLALMGQMGETSGSTKDVSVLRSSDFFGLNRLLLSEKLSFLRKFSSEASRWTLGLFGLPQESAAAVSTVLVNEFGVLRDEGNIGERMMNHFPDLVDGEESLRVEICSQKVTCMNPSSKMGNSALAGALAGTFVSLWLHPIDTVKTVIQARNAGHGSLFCNLGSIMSERGIQGLYRGIGSNLASSAPISAIYTFTYEFVKAALLPHLAKEHRAFAHCAAGACASIATSVIFTPSECIKQQMQVGSQYSNSWRALTGTLDKGGLPLLYAGWGAVLCRNVPQSVIKFYTYEGLKHWAQRSHTTETHLCTLQTLAFGGLAGSTAALFTTPFDVIKTRLQTQIPGSTTYYEGVFHALKQIARKEGLGGLYRGLLPRLVIYVSQGALFFASYEFFKRVLSIEVRRLSIQASQCGAKNMGRSTNVKTSA